MELAVLIAGVVFVLLVALFTVKTVRIVPQARARNVERLGRYRKTLEPGMNVIIPFIDRVKPLIDLREQVVSFQGQRVITEDNLVVTIDTVLFFQVTDPRAADYEIVNYIQAVEQLTATMLRSVIGSMDLEQALTSRDKINTMLRGVLDDASGKWGIRVTRVEIKAIDPPQSVKDAMEKQMRAEREKRAAILTAEGVRQSQILTADGDKQGNILRAEGEKQGAILRAEGQAQAISAVFQSIHENDPDPKLLAYQYLQTLPQLAQGPGNTVWMVPSELTSALKMLSSAFEGAGGGRDGAAQNSQGPVGRLPWAGRAEVPRPAGPAQVESTADDAAPAAVTAPVAAGAEATANGTDPASAGAEATADGTDPASASAEATANGTAEATAEATANGTDPALASAAAAPAGAEAGATSKAASAAAAGAVAAADAELAAAVREAADGAAQAGAG
jgi:regulator of protease activity HflC (stomatin/prohibitin superfamily)